MGSPCCPRDFQESYSIARFKNINSLALNFFIVQLSHPYMTTGKIIALIRRTFVSKVMSLLFNMLSRLVILIGKDSDAGRDWGQEEKGTTEDEMAGWHH